MSSRFLEIFLDLKYDDLYHIIFNPCIRYNTMFKHQLQHRRRNIKSIRVSGVEYNNLWFAYFRLWQGIVALYKYNLIFLYRTKLSRLVSTKFVSLFFDDTAFAIKLQLRCLETFHLINIYFCNNMILQPTSDYLHSVLLIRVATSRQKVLLKK